MNKSHILFSFNPENRFDHRKALNEILRTFKDNPKIKIGFGFTGTIPFRIDVYCEKEEFDDVYSVVLNIIEKLSVYRRSVVINHNNQVELRCF